jgi:hypothetical protein
MGHLNTLKGVTSPMDESTSFEMIDRIIQESIRPVLKADGGDITLLDFNDEVVKIALEKTRVPVTFSNFLVTFKVRTGCSLVPYYRRLRDLVHKRYRVLNSVRSLDLVSRYKELPEVEERSSKRRKIEGKLENLDEQLLRLSAGATVEDLVQDARVFDPDRIEPQVINLSEEINVLEEEKSRLNQTIGEQRKELNMMDGSARAVELAEDAQTILLRLRLNGMPTSGLHQPSWLRQLKDIVKNTRDQFSKERTIFWRT